MLGESLVPAARRARPFQTFRARRARPGPVRPLGPSVEWLHGRPGTLLFPSVPDPRGGDDALDRGLDPLESRAPERARPPGLAPGGARTDHGPAPRQGRRARADLRRADQRRAARRHPRVGGLSADRAARAAGARRQAARGSLGPRRIVFAAIAPALLLDVASGTAQAPAEPTARPALEQHVRYLAADERLGRATGTPGALESAQYLAAALAEAGVPPAGEDGSYFQAVPVRRLVYDAAPRVTVHLGDGSQSELVYGIDFQAVVG